MGWNKINSFHQQQSHCTHGLISRTGLIQTRFLFIYQCTFNVTLTPPESFETDDNKHRPINNERIMMFLVKLLSVFISFTICQQVASKLPPRYALEIYYHIKHEMPLLIYSIMYGWYDNWFAATFRRVLGLGFAGNENAQNLIRLKSLQRRLVIPWMSANWIVVNMGLYCQSQLSRFAFTQVSHCWPRFK